MTEEEKIKEGKNQKGEKDRRATIYYLGNQLDRLQRKCRRGVRTYVGMTPDSTDTVRPRPPFDVDWTVSETNKPACKGQRDMDSHGHGHGHILWVKHGAASSYVAARRRQSSGPGPWQKWPPVR
ncbi:hypothetical protein FALBO_8297 [Fusarium albosuccineum]|uniref:Uncharacterized protein n=1 Tax=Fusarium albosuccineum TaxID=1237068 RepID=A0A8H4PA21_9HYPO|nr:hypothetical protein FALBO_8297 [Fusarium albosuccineum]